MSSITLVLFCIPVLTTFEKQYIYTRIHLKRETTLWISKSLRSFLPWGLARWWLVRKNKFSSSKFWVYVGSKCIISKNRTALIMQFILTACFWPSNFCNFLSVRSSLWLQLPAAGRLTAVYLWAIAATGVSVWQKHLRANRRLTVCQHKVLDDAQLPLAVCPCHHRMIVRVNSSDAEQRRLRSCRK